MSNEWKIYHNPNCSKSREALEYLRSKGVDPKVVEYLKSSPSEAELRELMLDLHGEVAELVRVKDEEYRKAPFALDKVTIAKELSKRPALLERPIVVNKKGAVVARPLDKLDKLF